MHLGKRSNSVETLVTVVPVEQPIPSEMAVVVGYSKLSATEK